MKFSYLQQEIEGLKVQLRELQLREDTGYKRPTQMFYTRATTVLPDVLDYSLQEMLTSVEFEKPVCQKEAEKLETDHQVLKQLIANIERNRIKWRA